MSQIQREIKEFKILKKAVMAVAFMLFSYVPMHILGWLVSAIARHPQAEQAIASEPVYKVISLGMGGASRLQSTTLVMLALVALICIAFLFRATGYAHPEDGMKPARVLILKFLLPAFLSPIAFITGVMSQGTTQTLAASSLLFLTFGIFGAFIHYIVDITEDLPREVVAKHAAMDAK